MSFEIDISPIENETADFLHRLHGEIYRAFLLAKKNDGVTQSQIANILNVDKSHVSRILRGSGNPTAKTIAELAYALNCKPSIAMARFHAVGNQRPRDIGGSASSQAPSKTGSTLTPEDFSSKYSVTRVGA